VLSVAVEIGSATKPRSRSDHTSWVIPPARTAIRGTLSIGSSAGKAPVAPTKVTPVSLPTRSSIVRVATSAAKTALPAGSTSPFDAVSVPRANCAGTPLRRSSFSVRTAVGEFIFSPYCVALVVSTPPWILFGFVISLVFGKNGASRAICTTSAPQRKP
jgi:hypothetical protein